MESSSVPTVVFVIDENSSNPIYIKKTELIPEEKLFLHNDKLLENNSYLFYLLLKEFHSLELELYINDLKNFDPNITMKTLLTINNENWDLISKDKIAQLSKNGNSFNSYTIKV